jgi:hypothetical protein
MFKPVFISALLSVLCAALAISGTLPAGAAVHPYYQRQREIQIVLGSDAVRNKLMARGVIDRIELIAPYRYRVHAGPCRLEVKLPECQ